MSVSTQVPMRDPAGLGNASGCSRLVIRREGLGVCVLGGKGGSVPVSVSIRNPRELVQFGESLIRPQLFNRPEGQGVEDSYLGWPLPSSLSLHPVRLPKWRKPSFLLCL